MLFEKFVEQHRVYRLVAHTVELTVFIAHYQVRVHVGYILGDQAKLRCLCLVALVVKCHGLEGEDGFAGVVRRLNLVLKPVRRAGRAKLTGGVDHYGYGIVVCCCHSANVADKAAVAHVPTGVSDTNNVVGRLDINAGIKAQAGIIAACGAVKERTSTTGRVARTGGVAKERAGTVGRVGVAGDAAKERIYTVGGIFVAGGVGRERTFTSGRVGGAGGVPKECIDTVGCVEMAGGVVKERINTIRRIEVADRVQAECTVTVSGVAAAECVEIECLKTVGRVRAVPGVTIESLKTGGRVGVAGAVTVERLKTGRGAGPAA